MAVKFLDNTGLGYFWGKIKAWCNSTFAAIAHTHTSYAVKHSYTTTANAAKNWYRIANANTSQTDLTKPIHTQFILTAYNASYDTGYYERWFVNAEVFGRTAHIVIFGNSQAPFSQARILYENTIADLDTNDRPAIDIYLNYALANGTTKIEIEEVYNSGWTFVANGQISASTVPTGFESQACDTIRGNGVGRSNYSDWASYTSLQRSNFSANFTLADNNTYRARVLNCTGNITVTVPSINSVNAWFIIKNFNTGSGNITIHPSTTSVLIDGSNDDIILRPTEYIMIHSKAANAYTIVFDGRRRFAMVGRSGTVGSNPKHWFLVAETINAGTSQDIYISFKVFVGSGTTQCGGILNAHARVDATKGVVSNIQLQWEYKTQGIALEDFAITNIDTSGTSTNIQIWCKLTGAYSHYKFVVISEQPYGDATDVHTWKLTRARKTDGDIASLDTGFTNVVTSTLLTIANSITGNAATASAVAWSGITNKPTTISGYGITDAKITNGIITLGSNSITPLTSHQTLPTLSRTISGSGNAITNITVSNHAITATKGSTFALDSDVIHKNSNETIEGIKEFSNSYYDSTREDEINWESSSILLRMQNYDKGTVSSYRKYANLLVLDYDGINQNWSGRLGAFETCVTPEGANWVDIASYKNEVIDGEDAHEYSNLRVGYDENGIRFAFAPSTSEDRTYGQDILTRNWIPKDTRIVHTTGNEVVGGNKICESNFYLKHNIVKGTIPSTASYRSIVFTDNTVTTSSLPISAAIGQLRSVATDTGDTHTDLLAFKYTSGSSDECRLQVGYQNNIAYAIAPSTSTTRTNGTDIITRDFIPNDTRIVHTSGNEYVNGIKMFNNTMYFKHSDLTKGTNPNNTKYFSLICADSTATFSAIDVSKRFGKLEWSVMADGSSSVQLSNYANVSTNVGASITIGHDTSNLSYATAPETRTDRNNSNDILTRSWIPNDTRIVHTTGNETIAGTKTFSNTISGSINGTSNNVTGTVAIANGGTGATTRLNAVKALTNENVGTDATYFLTITNSWGKAGYTAVSSAKTVLGINNVPNIDTSNGQNVALNTASRAVVTDANKKLAVSSVTSTELGYVSGVTSAIQTQLNNKANDSSVVHLANTETITGHKFFTATVDVSCNIAKGTNPNSKLYRGLSLSDNSSSGANDARFGLFEGSIDTDGTSSIYMRAYDWTVNSANNVGIGIIYPKGGTPYTFAVTPSSTSDNGTKIATTEWVRSATGNTALNAATATKLATPKTIALTGALTGSASFDGSANANIELIRRACSNRNPSNPPTTAPYYKIASLTASSATETRNYNVTFLVENTYSSEFIGLLHIDVRYNNGSIVSESYIKVGWRVGYTSHISVIVPEATVRDTVEVWAEIPLRWMGYRFTVISDGTDVGTSNNWTLYSNIQASSNTSLPTGWVITPEYATVDTIQDQNIGGTKTFLNEIYIKRANPYLHFIETDWAKGDTTGSTSWQGIYFRDKNEAAGSSILYHYNPTSQQSYITFTINKMAASTDTNTDAIHFIYDKTSGAVYRPNTNGTILFGTSNYRWKEIWCTQSSINSSSDIRLKNSITNISDELLNAWDSVEWINFKYNDASEEKGIENARIHSGIIAQQVKKVFEDNGLDISKYGFFLYDRWNAQEAEYDEEGNLLSPAIEAGDQYGLRYVEALCIEAAYQRHKNKILENRILELEKRLAKLEGNE